MFERKSEERSFVIRLGGSKLEMSTEQIFYQVVGHPFSSSDSVNSSYLRS